MKDETIAGIRGEHHRGAEQTPAAAGPATGRRAAVTALNLFAAFVLVLGLAGPSSAAGPRADSTPHPAPTDREEARAMLASLPDAEVRKLLLDYLDRSLPSAQDASTARTPWVLTGRDAARARLLELGSRFDELDDEVARLAGEISGGSGAAWFGLLAAIALCLGAGALLERFLLRRGGALAGLVASGAGTGPGTEGPTVSDAVIGAAARCVGALVFLAGAVLVLHLLPGLTSGTRLLASATVWLIGGSRLVCAGLHALLIPTQGGSPWPISGNVARAASRHLCIVAALVLLRLIDRDVLGILGAEDFFVLFVSLVNSTLLIAAIIAAILALRRAGGRDASGGVGLAALLRDRWHQLAVIYVLAIYAFAIYGFLVTGKPMLVPGLTSLALLLACPVLDHGLKALAARVAPRPPDDDRDFWQDPEEAAAVAARITEHTEAGTQEAAAAAARVTGHTGAETQEAAPPAQTAPPAEAAHSEEPVVEAWHEAPDPGPTAIQAALHSNFRLLLGLALVAAIAAIWNVRIITLVEALIGAKLAAALLEIGVSGLFAFIVWQIIKAAVAANSLPEPIAPGVVDEGGATGLTRRQTLMPLIARTVGAVLTVMMVMITLSAFGVDIGPLIAGAGVVGLAVGFGAQTLVRDIVSGVFFLVDDAFRMGEYVTIGNIRGTVEKISVRSLRLRHHRGPLHTLPYGEIQSITNYSRDYAIMKFEVRVPFETDVEKVRKLIKKVGVDLMENEELAKVMLEPLKSQGVNRMDDSSFVIRCKFTTLPGKQFTVRRYAYAMIQEAFAAEGIAFAPRRVVVETVSSAGKRDPEAAAAAAAAMDEPESTAGRDDR